MYLVEDAHEAIIEKETFKKVQELKGHIKAAEMGLSMNISL